MKVESFSLDLGGSRLPRTIFQVAFACGLALVLLSTVAAEPLIRQERRNGASSGAVSEQVETDSDHFTAGLLGMIPVTSGFYVTSQPQLGLFFTAMDIAFIGAIYNAQTTQMQNRDNTKRYLALLGASNLIDMYLSFRQSRSDAKRAETKLRVGTWVFPDGSAGLNLTRTF